MRIIATILLFTLLTTFAWGQKEVILENNFIIHKAHQLETGEYLVNQEQASRLIEKSLCTEAEDGILSILSGKSKQIRLTVDTFGLGGGGSLICIDCNELSFGDAAIVISSDETQTDSLLYQSTMGIDAGLDTLHIQYCNTDTCGRIQEIVFLVRRAGKNIFPATINVNQEETVQVEALNDLPGELSCSFFSSCPDQYEGRDQVAYFTDYSMPTNEIRYHASRFAGLDSTCVVLCDEYGICDTTHFAFQVDVPSVNFPFYDDFYSESPYPEQAYWLDKEVFINKQMALDPPSVGVATFDGIDYRGRAYDSGFGPTDRLTSTYINVPSSVTFPTLSFWFQRGGVADRPEIKDSLVVQFKNQAGDWISVLKIKGLSSSIPATYVDTFKFRSIPLGPDFQHNRFQFRFLAHSDGTGYRDNWHLDYIRLDNNEFADSLFNDISFTKEPDYLLNNYTSLPWRHFQPIVETELKSTIDVGVFNHFAETQNASSSAVRVDELNTGSIPLASTTLFNGIEGNIENQIIINKTYDLEGSNFPVTWPNYLTNIMNNNYDELEAVHLSMEYSLENNSQNNADFVNINDQVSRTTTFSNYFSYDDGTAESALTTEPGLQFAVGYSAGVADTIRGVQILFPFTGDDFTDQDFRLRIWIGELDDTPEYSQSYQPVYPSAFFDTLQGFTSYRLVDELGIPMTLAIPEGPFYVGWQQQSSCFDCIAVGYDRNRPQGKDFIYAENGNGWVLASGFRPGALMIRPVVGHAEPIGATALNAVPKTTDIRIFPNPSSGIVYFQTEVSLSSNSEIRIFNSTGQLLLATPFQQELNLNDLAGGVYVLQVLNAEMQLIANKRLLIVK